MKKKHKFQIGQLIQVKNTPYVSETIRKRYGYILALWNNDDEPQYKVVIQGFPSLYYILFQAEIKPVSL